MKMSPFAASGDVIRSGANLVVGHAKQAGALALSAAAIIAFEAQPVIAGDGESDRAALSNAADLRYSKYSFNYSTPNRGVLVIDPQESDYQQARDEGITRRSVVRTYEDGKKIDAQSFNPDAKGGAPVTVKLRTEEKFDVGDNVTIKVSTTARKGDESKTNRTLTDSTRIE
jgi:hypothetical protein